MFDVVAAFRQPLAKLEFAIMITTLLRHYEVEVRVFREYCCNMGCQTPQCVHILETPLLWSACACRKVPVDEVPLTANAYTTFSNSIPFKVTRRASSL